MWDVADLIRICLSRIKKLHQRLLFVKKRKLPDDNEATKSNIDEIKKQMSEMLELLKSYKSEQTESINKLS